MKESVAKKVLDKTIASELYGLDVNGQMYDNEGKPLDKEYQEELETKLLKHMYAMVKKLRKEFGE